MIMYFVPHSILLLSCKVFLFFVFNFSYNSFKVSTLTNLDLFCTQRTKGRSFKGNKLFQKCKFQKHWVVKVVASISLTEYRTQNLFLQKYKTNHIRILSCELDMVKKAKPKAR